MQAIEAYSTWKPHKNAEAIAYIAYLYWKSNIDLPQRANPARCLYFADKKSRTYQTDANKAECHSLFLPAIHHGNQRKRCLLIIISTTKRNTPWTTATPDCSCRLLFYPHWPPVADRKARNKNLLPHRPKPLPFRRPWIRISSATLVYQWFEQIQE